MHYLPAFYEAEFASFLEMAHTSNISEPNKTGTEDGKLVDLARFDAEDDETAVKAKGLVHRY
ncbi:hypothetical protein Aspvir_003730 [Aspergillus viridinutans]|uniref:Uncharacterized protein n=1 Tax=Aspergillus viridinutans TaxID=75553 RepID=A0A9P3EZX2_ASPVI|nr:uncharacterized protein Aspvir_003730 [Aspergillus viridinutans]GIJ99728.1 hypothetical protein Aspvir_003730 [Aspergillus viridinutans]